MILQNALDNVTNNGNYGEGIRETCRFLSDLHENSVSSKIEKKRKEDEENHNRFIEKLDSIKEKRKSQRESYDRFSDYVLTEMLTTALNAIYMTALTETMVLTNNTQLISESLVSKYIEEHGGAQNVLNSMNNKTYLLDTIKTIVEEAEEEVLDKVDKEDPSTQEIAEDTKKNMFDKLEKEDDVEAAVNIIASRISSAEEEFIKKNAEDKEKIEKIISDINNRIKLTKQDPRVDEKEAEEIEQECNFESKRIISDIRDSRPHTVLEMFVRSLSNSIVQESENSEFFKETYYTESGRLDMENVVEASKCLYGFLEFVNTIQLESVDEDYIKEVLEDL